MKAVRELRQRKAYYRCCIPALAGFVSLRSIVPDGCIQMDQLHQNGNGFLAQAGLRLSLDICALVFALAQECQPGGSLLA